MSKYYREEDLQRALIGFIRETGIDEKPYDYAVNILDTIPSIEVSEDAVRRKEVEEMLEDAWVDGYEYSGNLLSDLEKLQSVIPQVPSEDAISRSWVLNEISTKVEDDDSLTDEQKGSLSAAKYLIRHAPPVVPRQKYGEWIADDNGDKKCSNCGEYAPLSFDDYYMRGGKIRQEESLLLCPYCGAKRKGTE